MTAEKGFLCIQVLKDKVDLKKKKKRDQTCNLKGHTVLKEKSDFKG